jgi:hypothetical protein
MTFTKVRVPETAAWAARARCSGPGIDPDHWFSERPAVVAYAVSVCRGCPVQLACLSSALVAGESLQGVWGGMTAGQRRRLLGRIDAERQAVAS